MFSTKTSISVNAHHKPSWDYQLREMYFHLMKSICINKHKLNNQGLVLLPIHFNSLMSYLYKFFRVCIMVSHEYIVNSGFPLSISISQNSLIAIAASELIATSCIQWRRSLPILQGTTSQVKWIALSSNCNIDHAQFMRWYFVWETWWWLLLKGLMLAISFGSTRCTWASKVISTSIDIVNQIIQVIIKHLRTLLLLLML